MPDNEVLKVIKEQGFKAFFDYASIGINMVNSRLEILLAKERFLAMNLQSYLEKGLTF